ncbi:branched-chain amino acid ABC transporter permease [Actinomadura decatromicini]|uniref:Branched-chain amino acid ABC transporter permease n=1 Tax=Actinomadura decatromicini TaxID=2604572 RepID=A0A5D3F586_9ACTN|nr:branched-chain amino acid ABC transporter permease [Actinomadura decatromicini]TYK43078.1 branched-chain amino acid ABC transporter permease [Actinomadura decatromicini]
MTRVDGLAARRRGRSAASTTPPGWRAPVALGLMAAVAPMALGSWVIPLLVPVAISSVSAVGLSLLVGRAGLISLGQGALAGVGAFTAASVSVRLGAPPELALCAAVVAGGAVACALTPFLRLSGLYLSLATLVLALMFQRIAVLAEPVTGGADGVAMEGSLRLGVLDVSSEATFYAVAWAAVIVTGVLVANVQRSRIGRSFEALSVGEDLARSVGVRVTKAKSTAFVISGLCSGLSGGLYAYYNQFLTPEQFSVGQSIVLLAAVIVGGPRSPWGGVVGLVVLQVLPEAVDLGSDREALLTPLLLLVFAGFLPQGLVAAAGTGLGRLWRLGPLAHPSRSVVTTGPSERTADER